MISRKFPSIGLVVCGKHGGEEVSVEPASSVIRPR
jgi:hypothetical protein